MANVLNTEQVTLQLTRHYAASPARVFQAWTDPQALKAWFAPDPAANIPDAEVDLRVGGRYHLRIVNPDGQEHSLSGVYREIVPPARLVFTWAWAVAPDRESLVTIELHDRDGGTELVLTHEGLHEGQEFANHQHGWTGNLARLADFVR
jgi:uncharacterized protein YndB with AHSA1/START domain